ncbi:MAG: hypothetical protein ABI685_05950 [Ferruginibacter sp.]
MKLKITALLLAVFAIMLALMQTNCNEKKEPVNTAGGVTPVEFPNHIVPGFNFPEDSSVINGWISNNNFPGQYDSASIYKHAWGIWAGLTAQSGQTYGGDSLRIYQTWLGKSELKDLIMNDSLGCENVRRKFGLSPLERPKQLEHGFAFARKNRAMLAVRPGQAAPPSEDFANFWVTVSYNPPAACFATTNKIYKASVINKYYNAGGLGAIPVFPAPSITVKPAYLVFDNTDSLFKFPVWKTAPNPANDSFNIGFPNAMQYVYIDKNNGQPVNKAPVPVSNTENDPAKIAAATVNLADFISLTIDSTMAAYMNAEQNSLSGIDAVNGQIAVLAGMHVTSKEITNWTWQSFYWTPTPATPGLPSCDLAASLRPKEITGAAAHYACVTAYVMLTPNNAPNNTPGAGPIFGYNPYLEGSFGPGVFAGYPNTYNASYQYGVQSNCMSCHALAIADTNSINNVAAQYTTDQTIDLKGSYFKSQVSVDFAWSVQSAFIRDTIPYWDPLYGKAPPPKK